MRVNLNVQGCSIVAPPMHAPSRTPLLLPQRPPPSFPQSPYPPRSLVRDERTHPHRPRLVVSHSTCPPLSSPPPREQLCNRSCSNKHTHSRSTEMGGGTSSKHFGPDRTQALNSVISVLLRQETATWGGLDLDSDGVWDGDYGWGVRVRRPFGARGRSSVRYGTRLGDLKENWFLLISY